MKNTQSPVSLLHGPHKSREKTRIVVFLGAGASAFADYRTFSGFSDLLLDPKLRKQQGLPPLDSLTFQILNDIFHALKARGIPATHDNFLWALGDYRPLSRILRVDTVLRSRFVRDTAERHRLMNFTEAVDHATDYVTLTTVRHYSSNKLELITKADQIFAECKAVWSFYQALAVRNNSRRPFLPIFTTNYDMLLEDVFQTFSDRASGFRFVNGIAGITTEGAEWSDAHFYQMKDERAAIHLYRLHGCVCWCYDQAGAVHFARRENGSIDAKERILVYPGSTSALGALPHSFAFRRFSAMVATADLLVTIGFSFRDDDVNQMLAASLFQRSRRLGLLVVDPMLQETDVIDRISNSVRRTPFPALAPHRRDIRCINMPFGQAGFDLSINESIARILKS